MELNWSTYLLEIVNFLVLVWILQRFLYRPVMDVIARRRAAIEQLTAQAEATKQSAEALKAQFDGRLADWEREKQQLREALQQEMDALRSRRLAELQAELAVASERTRVRDERRLASALEAREREALELAGDFAARLLERLAGPGIEAQLIEATLQDLQTLPAGQRQAVGAALQAASSVRIASAYPLVDGQSDALRRALAGLSGGSVTCTFELDSTLLAGLRIIAGPWILRSNLQDDLQSFAANARDGRQD